MSIAGLASSTGAAAAGYATAAAKPATASTAASAATASTGPAQAGDSVALSPLATSLRGSSLDLFNNLDATDRTALNDLVAKGTMSAEEVNLALKDRLKQARNQSFNTSAAMFARDNEKTYLASPDEATAESMAKAVSDHLERRMALVSRLEELSKAGKAGSEEYGEVVRTLAGQPAAEEEEPLPQPDRTGHAGRGAGDSSGRFRITTPFFRSLVDSRFTRTGAEKAAGEALTAAGFASAGFDRTVRAMAEKDVNAVLAENTNWLAGVMNGEPREPPKPPADPDFREQDIAARVG